MIIEKISLTTTPTSIRDLVDAARTTTLPRLMALRQILLKIDPTSTAIVYAEEEDRTATPVSVLDPANSLTTFAAPTRNLDDTLLSASEAVDIDLVAGLTTI